MPLVVVLIAAIFMPGVTTTYSGTLAGNFGSLVVAVGLLPNATWQLVVARSLTVFTPACTAVDVCTDVLV
jgi:hypothetical protein